MTETGVKARGAVPLFAAYLGFGAYWGCWSVILLEFVGAHGFTYSRQSWYMMALTAAAMVSMILLSPHIVRLLPSISLPISVGLYGLGIVIMPFAGNEALLAAFAITGVGTGLIDILVNQVGHGLETTTGRSVLQGVHAGYSVGCIAGSIGAAVILEAGGPDAWKQALVYAAVLQAPGFLICLLEPAFRRGPTAPRATESISLVAFRRRPGLLPIALIVLSAFFVEGSLDVWAATYLRETLGAGIMAGALGFSAFALAMAIGRVFAGRILFGMGYRRTILFSGIGSVLAGTLAVFAPNAWVATIAYLLLGFCLAAASPAAFGSVPGSGTEAGVAIAAVTTVGYTGFVIGPPVMGWLADATGIRGPIVLITLATLGILLGGFLSRDYARDPG